MCKNVSLDSSVWYRVKIIGGLVRGSLFVLLNLYSVYLIPVLVDINRLFCTASLTRVCPVAVAANK